MIARVPPATLAVTLASGCGLRQTEVESKGEQMGVPPAEAANQGPWEGPKQRRVKGFSVRIANWGPEAECSLQTCPQRASRASKGFL